MYSLNTQPSNPGPAAADRIPIRIVESYDTMILPNQNDINSTLYPKS